MQSTNIPNINTPHNNLFIQVLSRKDKAIAFFTKYLPAQILEIADLSQIELIESKHMSDAGISLYNDVLYRCPLREGQFGYFFAVSEHQSTIDPNMPLRLLDYDIAIIKGHLKQGHSTFPIVVNTVLYTGKKPWNYSAAFDDYYALPNIGSKYLHLAEFRLIQLPSDKQEAIYRDKDLGFCFAAFYSGRTGDAYLEFEKFKEIPAFQNYFNTLSQEERLLLARYIAWCVDKDRYSLEKVVDLLVTNNQEKEALMRSVAQEYIEKGKYEVARAMLLEHMDVDTVQKFTKLNKGIIQNLLNDLKNVKESQTK